MKEHIYRILLWSVAEDYAKALMDCEEFIDFVVDDIMLTSGYEEDGSYGDDDIRFAIGRAICWKFGLEF